MSVPPTYAPDPARARHALPRRHVRVPGGVACGHPLSARGLPSWTPERAAARPDRVCPRCLRALAGERVDPAEARAPMPDPPRRPRPDGAVARELLAKALGHLAAGSVSNARVAVEAALRALGSPGAGVAPTW